MMRRGMFMLHINGSQSAARVSGSPIKTSSVSLMLFINMQYAKRPLYCRPPERDLGGWWLIG